MKIRLLWALWPPQEGNIWISLVGIHKQAVNVISEPQGIWTGVKWYQLSATCLSPPLTAKVTKGPPWPSWSSDKHVTVMWYTCDSHVIHMYYKYNKTICIDEPKEHDIPTPFQFVKCDCWKQKVAQQNSRSNTPIAHNHFQSMQTQHNRVVSQV